MERNVVPGVLFALAIAAAAQAGAIRPLPLTPVQPSVDLTRAPAESPKPPVPASAVPHRYSVSPELTVVLQNDNDTVWGQNTLRQFFGARGEAARLMPQHPCYVRKIHFYIPDGQTLSPMTWHVWPDNGGHKPMEGMDLLTVTITPVVGWNEYTFPSSIKFTPPQALYVGYRAPLAADTHVGLDTGLANNGWTDTVIYGEFDTNHSGPEWVIIGSQDYGDGPRNVRLLVRLEVEYVDELTRYRFEDIAAQLGITGGGRVAWGDFNSDGNEDLLLDGQRLFKNNGGPDYTFTDVSTDVGVGGSYSGAMWADYDNDGNLDFCAIVENDSNQKGLFHNMGPPDYHFENLIAAQTDLASNLYNTAGAAWVDYDRDGLVDLYLAGFWNWDYTTSVYYPDFLYHNDGPPGYFFRDVSVSSGIRRAAADETAGRGVNAGDYDDDNFPDIYVSAYLLQPNFLFHNNQDGTLTEVAQALNVAGTPHPSYGSFGHTIGSVWGDPDNDLDLDLFTATLAHSNWLHFSSESNLYINSGPSGGYSFTDEKKSDFVNLQIGYNETHSDPSFIDYNNDGRLDLMITCVYDGWFSEIFRNMGTSPLTYDVDNYETGIWVNNGWGHAWADYDNDGDVDQFGRGYFYKNMTRDAANPFSPADSTHFIKVKCIGSDGYSNRSAIGARVTVVAGSLSQMHEVSGGRGTTSQESLIQHFGLGAATAVDYIEVRWPSTCVPTRVTNPGIDRVVTVYEPCGMSAVAVHRGTSEAQLIAGLPYYADWAPITTPFTDAGAMTEPELYYQCQGGVTGFYATRSGNDIQLTSR